MGQKSSVPKGNLAQRGVSGLAEGVDSLTGGTSAQHFVDRNGLGTPKHGPVWKLRSWDILAKDECEPWLDRNSLPPRRWQCVLWSKVHPWLAESNGFPAYHWKLLREYTKYCKVIATVDSKDTYQTAELIRNCCPDVEIREVQSPKDFQELLLGSAVYVGVGEPLIAPSCFEALSLGTHVVQPRFPDPRQLKNKPITQNWTSQHPFLEQVPEPYAFTVDPLDFEALATTFRTLRHAFDSIYTEERPVSFTDKALREFYMSGEYPGREEFSISGFLKRVAGTVTKTRTLEAADWDWERGDHPQQLPLRAFKK